MGCGGCGDRQPLRVVRSPIKQLTIPIHNQAQGAIMADPIPTPIPTPTPRTDIPAEPGLYFGVVRFPWGAGQTQPVLTPTSEYNAIVCVMGPTPNHLSQLAWPLPPLTIEASSIIPGSLQCLVAPLGNILKFGPKLDTTQPISSDWKPPVIVGKAPIH
jgi:hypothetical protein